MAIDWEWFEDENRLAETWPRFMPLLEEDAWIEANVPYRKWLDCGAKRTFRAGVVNRTASTNYQNRTRNAPSYPIRKRFTSHGSRALTFRAQACECLSEKSFYHQGPLIQRREIDLKKELATFSTNAKLSPDKGEKALDMARAASTIRYRELYGFTHGDPKYVYRAELGRGVELFLAGLPPEKRLPLRACHAAMIYKNGVPIGYFEGAFAVRTHGERIQFVLHVSRW